MLFGKWSLDVWWCECGVRDVCIWCGVREYYYVDEIESIIWDDEERESDEWIWGNGEIFYVFYIMILNGNYMGFLCLNYLEI